MWIDQMGEIPSEKELHIVDRRDSNMSRINRSARWQSAVSQESRAQSDYAFVDFQRWKACQQLLALVCRFRIALRRLVPNVV
jgi:hypothetical protein